MRSLTKQVGGMIAGGALGIGCAAVETAAPGAVMLVLTTDAPAGGADLTFDRVKVVVRDPRTNSPQVRRYDAAPADMPQTLTIAAKPGQGGAVTRIQVFAFQGETNLRVFREARVVLPPSGVEMLRMPLNVACDRVYPANICPPDQTCSGTPTRPCGDAETCVDGVCQAVEVPAGRLPAYSAGAEGACTPEGASAQCAGAGMTCGALTSADRCGEVKSVDCGRCDDGGVSDAGVDAASDTGPSDAASPVDAGPGCAPGTYVSGSTCSPCAVGTFSAATNAAQCRPWTTCAAGEFVASPGHAQGDRVCASCVVGTFTTGVNAQACTPWTACQAGQYIGTAGTPAADRSCSPCPSGSFSNTNNAASCAQWTVCLEGHYVSTAPTAAANRACTMCASGTYADVRNAANCAPWASCRPGQYTSDMPSIGRDRTCADCNAGTYSNTSNASNCSPCAIGTTSGQGATACSAVDAELAATTASMSGDGVANCGISGTDVCARSLLVTGGSFNRGNDARYPAALSDFRLDKYEVTVGRFRKFIDAWAAGWRPSAGAGKHAHVNAASGVVSTSGGFEAGWDSTWTPYLGAAGAADVAPNGAGAATRGDWDSRLSECAPYATWTPTAGSNEKKPINCVSWYDLHAFCVWDGGFLPTEAEWEFVAAAGAEQRTYPWGATAPSANTALAIYGCYFNASGTCSGTTNIAAVGSVPAGASKAASLDLAGNISEWTLDGLESVFGATCNNCANTTASAYRVVRGGSFATPALYLPGAFRYSSAPAHRYQNYGGRCARAPGGGACSPESDAAFCTRLGATCGTASGTDNCAAARTVASCGSCPSGQACNASNRCVSPPTEPN